MTLPSGFVTVQQVLEGKCRSGSLVNIVGVVTDFRAPMPPRGFHTDWKAEVEFYDKSVEYDTEASLSFHIFRPEHEMPDFGAGDAIALVCAKVQKRDMRPFSLITNYLTDIHVFSNKKIPRQPSDISVALLPALKKLQRQLTKSDLKYISDSYYGVDKHRVRAPEDFELRKIQSTNIKDKYCQLQHIQEDRFCDIIGQVVKKPYDSGDKITLWISDYTENERFFNHAFSLDHVNGSDPYGYGAADDGSSQPGSRWTGPFGRRSLQVTCYEPHATAIRDAAISEGSWVSARNLQVKFGTNQANLEGFLREDRGSSGIKINISQMDMDDPDTMDPRLKDALRRKRDYEQTKRHQIKSITEAAKAGQKRKASMADENGWTKENSKSRRKAKRAQAKKAEPQEPISPIDPQLNSRVKCENQNKGTNSVSDLLQPVLYDTIIDGESVQLALPFVNVQYRIQARVVDFFPPRLAQFARINRPSEFDVLSDAGESGSDLESESELGPKAPGAVGKWEWRFFLKLEDAVVDERQRNSGAWVLVDNHAAQCLINLDATNLETDVEALNILRERLFTLWGDLEERKTKADSASKNPSTDLDRPPLDSSDDEGRALREPQPVNLVANRPFSCCVRQYGIQVQESDPTKADAGKGKRWERVFGLFGTRIV